MQGDPNPWRDIGHAKWFDPYAGLEDIHGTEFKEAVAEELALWSDAISTTPVAKWLKEIKKNKRAETDDVHETLLWQGYTIRVQYAAGHRLNVWFLNTSKEEVRKHIGLTDFGVAEDTTYYTIEDVGNGAERLELVVYDISHKAPLWRNEPVGPVAGFHGEHIVFQSVENQLRYPKILWADKRTGSHIETLYHNTDKRFQVDLVAHKELFIRIHNALEQRIGRIVGSSGIEWLTPLSQGTLVPICYDVYGKDRAIVYKHKSYPLPYGEHIVDALPKNDIVIVTTVKGGFTSLYEFDKGVYTRLFEPKAPNEIVLHSYSTHPTVSITSPNMPTIVYEIVDHALAKIYEVPSSVLLPYFSHGTAKSKDGTSVPYTYVSMTLRPKKLLVEGYGSYGISSHRSYPDRWLAWLKHGYAYAVAMPRGGRENGDPWYNGGRTAQRKQNTFDDTATVIKSVQRRFHISPKKTVFYGRSAGGLLAANIAQQFPHLVGAIYAEVPYVDVLRTTSNPELPLTQLEYDEFGDPIKRPEDYSALQLISPVDTVPLRQSKQLPLVLVRTGVNDAQVLPYEALKWAKKLRALGWNVLVGIDTDGGHFAAESVMDSQHAEDISIIDNYFAAVKPSKTRKLRSHVSRGTKRRRTSSRKH